MERGVGRRSFSRAQHPKRCPTLSYIVLPCADMLMSYSAKSNVAIMLQFKEKLTESLGPGPIHLLLDCAPIHTSVKFRTAAKLQYPNIHMVHIPGGFTDKLQPLDLTVNRAFKSRLRTAFTSSAARMLLDGLRKGEAPKAHWRATELKQTLPTYTHEAMSTIPASFSKAWRPGRCC